MGHFSTWKVLEEMLVDLRKNGVDVPKNTLDDLKSARTLITIEEADRSRTDTSQKIEELLEIVESYLLSQGQKKLGQAYVDHWTHRINSAAMQPSDEEEEQPIRFVTGTTRGEKWVRITSTPELSLRRLTALAEEAGLKFTIQDAEHLVIYGADPDLRGFVRKMATKYRSQTEK